MGSPMLEDPDTFSCSYKPFSLSYKVAPFSLLVWSLFSFSFFSRIANPPSQYILIFIAQGEWRCYDYLFTCLNGGPIPSFLSGCSIGKGGNGIGIDSHLQKLARQRYSQRRYQATEYRVSPCYDTPNQVKDNREGLALGIQDSAVSSRLLGLDWALRCPKQGYRFQMGMG